MKALALAALALLLSGTAFAASEIVIDAGSTGTRVYEISREGCATPAVETLAKGGPLASTGDDTLGDLLDSIVERHPEVGSDDVRVIGTGGFRRLDPGSAQACGDACAAKRDAVLAATRARFPHVTMHVATGQEEGQLSRLSVAALTGDEGAVTVEIGGATVQVATPSESRMAAIGIKSLMPKAPACTAKPAVFSACRDELAGVLAADGDAAHLLETATGGSMAVGVGGVFANMARLLGGESISLDAVDALGRRACPAGDGFEAKYKDQACTQLALASILVERFGISRVKDVSLELGAALEQDADLGPSRLAAACRTR